MNPTLALALALVCVAANAFFVAAEFALAKVRPSSLEALAQAGDPKARLALKLTHKLDEYLSATQLGITLASLALGWLGESALVHLLQPAFSYFKISPDSAHSVAATFAFVVISILHIVVGEIVPKSLAILRPETVSRYCSRPLFWFYRISFAPLWVLNSLSNLILRMLRLPPVTEGEISADEIRLLVRASFGRRGESRTTDLLERVIETSSRLVRSIMIPRVDMVVVSTEDDAAHCLRLAGTHGFSRYPLCEDGDPDRVIGYVYVKDILVREARNEATSLLDVRRAPLFVPEGRQVGALLTEFQKTRSHLAIVVDEYGGTSGLVTLEDVLEEIVGEIQDEHDSEAPRVFERTAGVYWVDGSLPRAELQIKGLELEGHNDSDTVGGFIVSKLGRLARPGDTVECAPFTLRVLDVRNRRVSRVQIAKSPGDAEE